MAMRIAFYAPMKPPGHPVPSGDRKMARLLVEALRLAGHTVEIASELRTYMRVPSWRDLADLQGKAAAEVDRLAADWHAGGAPDLWFCYHPYYKSPDLIGPPLAARFDVPMVTVEASWSPRRATGAWVDTQAWLREMILAARLNICFTRRDRDGLAELVGADRLAMLPPFIDVSAVDARHDADEPARMVTVAMMRPGDKLESYRVLAAALALIGGTPWTLTVIGDGSCRVEVRALFCRFGDRITWRGEIEPAQVASVLAGSDLFVWPGCGEAFGIAYLEAQAAGLPVVALKVAGVPEVVEADRTGLLTPPGDVAAYAAGIDRLLSDGSLRRRMGEAARRFVLEERTLTQASATLGRLLQRALP